MKITASSRRDFLAAARGTGAGLLLGGLRGRGAREERKEERWSRRRKRSPPEKI